MSIIDLGAAPGSWSEYMSRKFKNTNILSIDLKEMLPIENTYQIKGDFTDNKNKTVKLVRIPKFSEVPYPIVMEPNLVIEYYSR